MTAPRHRPQVTRASGETLHATVQAASTGRCRVRWATALPARPAHPRLPTVGLEGEEELPCGVVLAALGLEHGHPGWRLVAEDLGSAAAALHAAGLAHGSITPSTAWIDADGQAWLLGAGLEAGTAETDTLQLQALAAASDHQTSLSGDPTAREALAQRVAVLLQATETEEEPDDITHSRPASGPEAFDEVAADLGPERGRGLFDDLRGETHWAEHTEPAEPTGPITDAARAVHRQLDVLVRLADDPPPDLPPASLAKIPDDARDLFQRALAMAQPASLPLPEVARPPALPGTPSVGVLDEVTAALEAPPIPSSTGETTQPRRHPGSPRLPTEPRTSHPKTTSLAQARFVLAVGVALVLLGALLIGAQVLSLSGG